ncbi:MAG: C40 family peptidase [Deltaproteobacteria bacterium]|nr:C40 family peptidase [Deltaproteobacteria bacterium]
MWARTRIASWVVVLLLALSAQTTEAADRTSRAARIRNFARQWLGTHYQWGGDSKAGIDCSAYVRRMYRRLFDVELPRTTKQQINLGVDLPVNPLDPSDGIQPGDVFFYVDRTGVPNHVVVYAGSNRITHSESGRGVVIDPIRKLWGRRVVARRFLVPARDAGRQARETFGPVPAAGPLKPREIPCPPSVRADKAEVRLYTDTPVPEMKALGEREICDYRVLANALRRRPGSLAKSNAAKLESYAEWIENIESLKSEIGRGW